MHRNVERHVVVSSFLSVLFDLDNRHFTGNKHTLYLSTDSYLDTIQPTTLFDEDTKYVFEIKAEEIEEKEPGVGIFVQSRKGNTILQYNEHRYRKAYKSKKGVRWNCSQDKNCSAFLFLNNDDEILLANECHEHPAPARLANLDSDDTAMVLTSRKGKEMLLFRQYTYRKQYVKENRSRWICSTIKNCRGCVFTDTNNLIISAFEDHCHEPPKYYRKPDHVIGALREPIIIETD